MIPRVRFLNVINNMINNVIVKTIVNIGVNTGVDIGTLVLKKALALAFVFFLAVSANAETYQDLDGEMAAHFSLVSSFVSAFYFAPHSEKFDGSSLMRTIKKPTRQDFGYDKLEIVDVDVENKSLRVHYFLEGQDMGELDFVIEQVAWDTNTNEKPRLKIVFSEIESRYMAIGVFGFRQDQKIVYNLTIDLNSQILYLEQQYHASQAYQWNPLPVSRLDGTIKFKTLPRQTESRRKTCQFHLLY